MALQKILDDMTRIHKLTQKVKESSDEDVKQILLSTLIQSEESLKKVIDLLQEIIKYC